ncbi:Antibiotic biosynthesis monooxygenase [Neisseria subflava]|uniref:Antibiotic biosynthesis monooxygenase n=1 Tax=Neisseria subflava TaxID=28449 RepID=A0A9X9SMF5_NEISU|nr:antibiotic biosynthesis monooxygenase [Neisseria subflava]VTY04031.1 Antibiotic biosynthesis monooxygenase [Neisseria subflava]
MALNTQAAPLMNLFELGVAEGKTVKYDQVAKHNISTSIANEKGTLAMYSVKLQANPEIAYMLEIYADNAAYQIHRDSSQYQAFAKVSPEILTDHKKRTALVPQFLGDRKIKQTSTTQTRLVNVIVKPEHNIQFSKIIQAEMAQSLKVEDGVLAMYAATKQDSPNDWIFFEIYTDEAAYQAHRETPHFKDYLKQTDKMIADKHYTAIQTAYLGNQGQLHFIR